MKAVKLLIALIFIYVLIVLPSCKGKGEDPGPDETESQRVTKMMIGTWNLKSVTVDGVAKDLYKNLAITFTTTGYSVANGSTIWSATGTWTFTDDNGKSFKREDQTVVNVDAVDANNLTLSMDWTKSTLGPGRMQSVAGKHVFVFSK